MKKLILLATMLSLAASTFAVEVEIDGLWYEVITKGQAAIVIQYKNNVKYNGDIVIPESVVYEGITCSVKSIGGRAFEDCSGLTSVTIPNSVTDIGERAFEDCSGLTSVTIPNSVTGIGVCAFEDCSGLKKVIVKDIAAWCRISFSDYDSNPLYYAHRLYSDENTEITELIIPNSVTYIKERAFYRCSGLTSVTIPNSVRGIGNSAFYRCSGLTSVTIPNSVTSIGNSAFYSCYRLTSVTIGNSVTSIGEDAFSYCSGLTSVTIPNSVTSIGNCAFQGCSGLTSVTIGNSVTSIGSCAFDGCSGLTSVTIGNSVTSIGQYAFYCCSGLTSVTIGNSVTSIGQYAFASCSRLTSVTIPNSVTSIGYSAFQGCSGLTSVTIGNSVTGIGVCAFRGCSGLKKVIVKDIAAWCRISFSDYYSNPLYYSHRLYSDENTEITELIIPNSVTSIGQYAFYNCSGLTSVTIGSGVQTIGSRAFESCQNLAVVYCYAENVPTTNSDAFNYSNIGNATLHVPSASVTNYAQTTPWSGFKSVVAISQCATPTIIYNNGEVSFECETEGVEFVSHLTLPPSDNTTNKITIPSSYTVTVYAKKDGYIDSDVATQEIDIRGMKGDADGNGVVDIADAVHIVNFIVGKINSLAPRLDSNQANPE